MTALNSAPAILAAALTEPDTWAPMSPAEASRTASMVTQAREVTRLEQQAAKRAAQAA